jgi:type IV secretory pathway VirB10-like protein
MAPQTKIKAKQGRRLKVFQAVFGFHESVVAAPSQAAALSAWGAHQNLFADGAGTRVTDPEVVAAALAHPLTPLRRAVGSKGPFGLDAPPPALDIPRARDKPPKSGRRAKSMPSKPEAPPPDRSALAAAEAALEQLEAAQKREQQDIRRRRQALDAEEAGARVRWAKDRAAARKAMKRERRAYLKAVARA